MKEFNLEEYLKNPSKKVVTRDGREVRIICTDMKSIYKIVGLVYDKKEDTESLLIYKENGKYYFEESTNDLFFAPIKREGWVNLFKDEELTFINGDVYDSEEEAKEEASESLKEYGKFIATIKIEWEE